MLNVAENAPKASLLTRVGSEFSVASPDKKAADWLDALVAKAKATKGGVITVIEDLTPARARAILNRNPHNRKVSDTLVNSIATDILNGEFEFNGETIIIADDGTQNDGQHRCLGAVKADKPILVTLVVGVRPETRLTVDQGRSKSGSDFLFMDGVEDANYVYPAASLYWQYKKFGMLAQGGNKRPTKAAGRRTLQENPDLAASVAFCKFKHMPLVGGRALLSFVHYAIVKTAPTEAFEVRSRKAANAFIKALATGESYSADNPILNGNPILYARTRLMGESKKLRGNFKAELIFKAWNAHRRGSALSRVQLNGSKLPDLERA